MFANSYFLINKSIPEDGFGIYQAELEEIKSGESEYPIKQGDFDSIENNSPIAEDILCTSGIGHLYCGVSGYNV